MKKASVLGVLILSLVGVLYVVLLRVQYQPPQETFPSGVEQMPDRASFDVPTRPATSTAPVEASSEWRVTPEVIASLEREWTRYDRTSISTSTASYSIGYADLFDSFTILIFAEPAAQYRKEAEDSLRRTLGIEGSELCAVNLRVMRRTELTHYTELQEIGVGGCPGALSDDELLVPYFF